MAVCGNPDLQSETVVRSSRRVRARTLALGLIPLALALATTAVHAGDDATRNPDKSAIIAGSLVIAENGTVQSTSLDVEGGEGADEAINKMILGIVNSWRFEPATVDGKPVISQTHVFVRLVAHQKDDGNFSISVKGATFTADASTNVTDYPQWNKDGKSPHSRQLERDEIGGTVYLALRIDGQGHVADVVPEQVNLSKPESDATMAKWREELATPAIEAARTWTFTPPTTGPLAAQHEWTIHVPVKLGRSGGSGRGKQPRSAWQTYVPGPVLPVPWLQGKQINASTPDALLNGAIAIEGTAPKFLGTVKQS